MEREEKMNVELKECRICSSKNLDDVLNLGSIYPSGFIKPDEILTEDKKSPLVLCQCKDCKLVQLRHTVSLDQMYRQYWYTSSLNKSMVKSLQDIVENIQSYNLLKKDDVIVDIGCNDGTMFSLFSPDYFKVGFDPALNLSEEATKHCDTFINDYFSGDMYFSRESKKAKVVTAIAMFYDLPNPVEFTKEVTSILADDGIFVVQFTDLLSMISATAFDNVCHEHLEYYSLHDVVNLLDLAELKVIDVSYNDVNGGSVRVISTHKNNDVVISPSVEVAMVAEEKFLQEDYMKSFAEKITKVIKSVDNFLQACQETGHTVYLLGASTKGNTLLQICDITGDRVKYAAEVNKEKFGLVTAGTGIEILPENEVLGMKPDFLLVPIWHFKESILKNPKIISYMEEGGVLIFPLPKFHFEFKKAGEYERYF